MANDPFDLEALVTTSLSEALAASDAPAAPAMAAPATAAPAMASPAMAAPATVAPVQSAPPPEMRMPAAPGVAMPVSGTPDVPGIDVVGLLADVAPAVGGAPTAVPAGMPPWLAGGQGGDAAELQKLPDVGHNAMYGDQRAIETLGRGFSRRDPVAGFDGLPLGRDSVTYSTAAVNTKHEAGQHWPELIAFRASDRYPTDDQYPDAEHKDGVPASVQYAPTWAERRVADVPAMAVWPGQPPTGRGTRARPTSPAPTAQPGATPPGVPAQAAATTSPSMAGTGMPTMAGSPSGANAPTTPAAPAAPAGVPPWLSTGASVPTSMPDAAPTQAPATPRSGGLDGVRSDFPALQQRVNGQPLVWLDNGATTQKPQSVIDAVSTFYERDNSNVHRGAHALAARATDAYEGARQKVQRYLGAGTSDEIVFVRGTTEGINLVAQAWGRDNVKAGDEILVSHLEHHANIVPWQQLANERGALLRPIPVDDNGDVRLDAYESMLSPRVKMVAVSQVSNALGTVVPVGPIAALAHGVGARVLVDAAQSVAHLPVDVSCLGADFLVFSGHKIYGPTGIGALWARRELLDSMSPWQGGGSMIRDVTFERTIYSDPPAKFEAGTPNLAGAVGLGAALDYVEALGRPQIAAWEHMLLEQMVAGLRSLPGLRIIGEPMMRAGAVSFVMKDHEPAEVAKHLDKHGIAVRAGHHCAQPILRRFGLEETVRPSVGLYNVPDDIERLIAALRALPSQRVSG
jgi:cysteine desulfurase/selenocysteine lyase